MSQLIISESYEIEHMKSIEGFNKIAFRVGFYSQPVAV